MSLKCICKCKVIKLTKTNSTEGKGSQFCTHNCAQIVFGFGLRRLYIIGLRQKWMNDYLSSVYSAECEYSIRPTICLKIIRVEYSLQLWYCLCMMLVWYNFSGFFFFFVYVDVLLGVICTFCTFFPACQLCCEQVLFSALSLCASVRLSVRTKCQKLLIRSWCNLVGIWTAVSAGSGCKLVTFDHESCFRTFSIQAIYFEWLDLAASSSV